MLNSYDEQWAGSETAQGHRCDQFPYEEVYQRLDGDSSDPEAALATAGAALGQLVKWATHVRPAAQHLVEIRMLAMAWTINPETFGGCSLTQLANERGLSPDAMHRASSDFSKAFGVRSPAQRHAWNFKRIGPGNRLAMAA